MRIIVLSLLAFVFVGCSLENNNRPTNKEDQTEQLLELDVWLDSMNIEGEYCLVRGSDREYDTIIDHIKYKYVKELGCDTPIKEEE